MSDNIMKKSKKTKKEKNDGDKSGSMTEKEVSAKRNNDDRVASRARRKKRSHDLRSKNVGVVGKIDIGQSLNNRKKTSFGDDDEDEVVTDEDKLDSMKGSSTEIDDKEKSDSSDDDEDDQVEEVKASTAKELAQKQRQQERETSEQKKKDSRKRKKTVAKEESDNEEEMDDAFFKELDMDLDEEQNKKVQAKLKPKGKRTTFIAEEDESINHTTDHSIQVVVLESKNNAMLTTEHHKASKKAELFSRNLLFRGDPKKKTQASKHSTRSGKSRKKPVEWKRSSKMSRIILAQSARSASY